MTSSAVPKKVLVAVAEGGLSDAACALGGWVAKQVGAELELLHGLPVPTMLGARWSEERTAEAARERRDALVAALTTGVGAGLSGEGGLSGGASGAELASRLCVSPGQPAKVVLERARAWHADLVVLGTSGHAKQLDFGGVARALFAQSPCPVLVVPGAARVPRQILVPVDLSPASLAALAIARDWALAFGARLVAVHCFSAPELVAYGIPEAPLAPVDIGLEDLRASAKQRFEREMHAFDWRGVPWDARFHDGAPADVVLELQEQFDLIALSTHGHTGLAAALLGSVAYDILRRVSVPALACPIRPSVP